MFRGSSIVNLDEKNRLAIPKKFREKLLENSSSLVLTAHPEKCLILYNISEWIPIEKKLMSLSSFDPKISSLQRLLVGYAEELAQDKAGRILISQSLMQFAEIQEQAIIIGQGTHFEIWDKSKWDTKINHSLQEMHLENINELGGFSL
ncbi:MAG: division/cell wall cluster transcriptional repressor MraZ [Methylophilaceae bacterium]|jgi:MraZ protein|nr:division/cell wall cluster transcriptional repressor MraZ [Methylophilaceae bacterium]